MQPVIESSRGVADPSPIARVGADPSLSAAVAAYRRAGRAVADAHHLDDALRPLLREACALAGSRRASVFLREDGLFRGQIVEPEADAAQPITALVCGTEADELTREIVRTRSAVFVPDARSDPRPVRAAMRRWEVRSILGVPLVVGDEVAGLLFLDEPGTQFECAEHTMRALEEFGALAAGSVAQALRTEALRTKLDVSVRQAELARRSMAVQDQVMEQALGCGGVEDLARLVARLTSKPCAVHGADDRYLAIGRPDDEGGPVPRLLNGESRDAAPVLEALAQMATTGPAIVGPFPTAGLHHRYIVAPVSVGGELRARLVLMEYGRGFSHADLSVARAAAGVLAIHHSVQQRVETMAADARHSLLRDLLRGSCPATLATRVEFHGVDVTGPVAVTVIAADRPGDRPPTPSEWERAASDVALLAEGFSTIDDDGRLVVIAKLDRLLARPAAIAELKRDLGEAMTRLGDLQGGLVAGVSGACLTIGEISRGFTEAERALSTVRLLAPGAGGHSVMASDDLGVVGLLLTSGDPDDADRFVRNTLGPLIDPEDQRVTDLLLTLDAFFETSRSIHQSALRLGVHDNTVRYRLARVAELTGLDACTDADDQLSLQVALTILRMGRPRREREIARV